MADAIDDILAWLLKASSLVGEEYMRLPVAGADPQYRERVYCYELYHQLRCQWPSRFPYVLCGEIDKRKHADVRGDYQVTTKRSSLVPEPRPRHAHTQLLPPEVTAADTPTAAIVKRL